MNSAARTVVAVITVGVWATASELRAQPASGPTATQPALGQAALEKQFEQTMSGAVLVGRFSDAARPNAAPKEDRYTIQRVSKIADGGGDRWLFICRIGFGRKELSVPLTIPVKWAGDTPVISVTDMTIPGMGTYTARVMIYADEYAGTWSGGTHRGHLWGRIERASTTRPAAATTRATQ